MNVWRVEELDWRFFRDLRSAENGAASLKEAELGLVDADFRVGDREGASVPEADSCFSELRFRLF